MPEFIVYDDACHLRRFVEKSNRIKTTERLESFSKYKFVVDKLHIQGHIELWCHQNCHPRLHPSLKSVNTVICEQVNVWLGGFKYAIKHMNVHR